MERLVYEQASLELDSLWHFQPVESVPKSWLDMVSAGEWRLSAASRLPFILVVFCGFLLDFTSICVPEGSLNRDGGAQGLLRYR